MGSWGELIADFDGLPDDQTRVAWIGQSMQDALAGISKRRGDRNVLFYASGFLQKAQVPAPLIQITGEDLNGFMSSMHGMDWSKGLTLLLHTPGGQTNAAETIVDYLRQKFDDVEVIVPTFAMSAGTMISLSADRVVMGRQSQLGPIDPQMPIGNRYVSARAIVDQFQTAKREILGDEDADIEGDIHAAHVWAPILSSLGPSLLHEAQNALDYGERMVANWLRDHMFKGRNDAAELGAQVAKHFNDATTHKSHGRRIGRDEARDIGVVVEDLEDDQALQEQVLTLYHLITITFEKGPATKVIARMGGSPWVKHHVVQQQVKPVTIEVPAQFVGEVEVEEP